MAEYHTGGDPLVAAADADVPFVPVWGLIVMVLSPMGIAVRQARVEDWVAERNPAFQGSAVPDFRNAPTQGRALEAAATRALVFRQW